MGTRSFLRNLSFHPEELCARDKSLLPAPRHDNTREAAGGLLRDIRLNHPPAKTTPLSLQALDYPEHSTLQVKTFAIHHLPTYQRHSISKMATTSRAPGANQQTQILQPTPQTSNTTRTQTQTQTQAVLHLRGAPLDSERGSTQRRIQWAEDVVDNEGLGRKKSKVCCIYHAPKGIDESSDESSSDSSSDESDSGDDGSARPVGGRGGKKGEVCGHGHGHGHGKEKSGGEGSGSGSGKVRKRSPNAYERMPKVKGAAAKEK